MRKSSGVPTEDSTENQGGSRVRADRTSAGMDLGTLSALTGYSRSHLRNVENGHRPITDHLAQVLADVLGTTPDRYISRHRGGDDEA